jgi:hypothetical protein
MMFAAGGHTALQAANRCALRGQVDMPDATNDLEA